MHELASSPVPPVEPAPQPGEVIAGKYLVDGYLGAGGMGVVLSALHLDLDAPVAIKVMREEFAKNEEVVSRMLFEARAAAKMRGAHVVRVLDVARLPSGAPYIVMERLEGRDLAVVLTERRSFPIQEAVDFLLQACEGLAEAHGAGIVHRDLKPENLFIASTPEGPVLKILDFGISKDIGPTGKVGPRSALTNTGFAVGSPYYMSPEQMRASTEIDLRADIWSLGAILFELLTGKCPFEGESLPVVCAKVLTDPAPSLSEFGIDVPPALDAIVRCCLQKEPGARFDSVGELAAALRGFASAEGQRCADRSARVASGINLKSDSDRGPRGGTPVSQSRHGAVCSSPALQPQGSGGALRARPVSSVADFSLARARGYRRRWLAVAAVASLGAAIAGAFWHWSAPERLASAEPGTTQPAGARAASLALPEPLTSVVADPAPIEPAPESTRSSPAAAVRPRAKSAAPRAAPPPRVSAGSVAAPTAPAPPPVIAAVAPPSARPEPRQASAWEGDRLGGRY